MQEMIQQDFLKYDYAIRGVTMCMKYETKVTYIYYHLCGVVVGTVVV